MKTRQSGLQRILKAALLLLALLCLGILIARFVYINYKFPSPRVNTCQRNETVTLGNYEIAVTDYIWGDDRLLQEMVPDFNDYYEASSPDDVRIAFVTLTVTKQTDDETLLDLTSLYFESGAWGNQFDMELFYRLNPEADSLYLDLAPGETRNVTIPMNMTRDHFRSSTWNKIDDRNFYLVLQYYPIKYQIQLQ